MRFHQLSDLVESDFYLHTGKVSMMPILRHLVCNLEFKYTFCMRSTKYLEYE